MRTARQFALLVALSLGLGFLGLGPGGGSVLTAGGAAPGASGGPAPTEAAGPATPGGPALGPTNLPGSGTPLDRSGRAIECAAGRNGGATDRGVSATRIRLATTAVLDGPAKSLLQLAPTGMKAVIDKVNRAGGICGRLLDLTVINDGFNARLGQQYIRNFTKGDYFGLAVVPSAEGLSAAIATKDVARAGIPVVGTDGMRIEQYREPWVWPVGTATVSTMRIMAEYGYRQRGARTFAIVWDSKYKFGIEGAEAFRRQVRSLGGRILADVPLDPEQPSYASEVAEFNNRCKDGACDMVALLLLPDAAEKWLARQPERGTRYTAGAQTLFTNQFAQSCVRAAGTLCHGLAVWTGYNPPIGSFATLRGVDAYVKDVEAVSPGIDVHNQFLEGAYFGMNLLVEALRKVGPSLTRARVRAVLDSMIYRTDIASALSWRPGRHSANTRARSFSIVVASGIFAGWRDELTGWVSDPRGGV